MAAEKAEAKPSGTGELQAQSSPGSWVLMGFRLSPAACVTQASELPALEGEGWPWSLPACLDICLLFVRIPDKGGCCKAGLLIHVPA